ncbi:hypothetical protein TEQG_02452 [Trichophyton equinum CBS 127.97]|uniref:Uncharacterized protein n=1 Tax=Trichophyton equinum (strain ATCC MYA-4606 / CBS 127.97) TaxID=559882 RepID=F2PNE8_TRIEC|nr:hypothetical protein TEQG_02452 [Trichophyton equinum CBS 127.97]
MIIPLEMVKLRFHSREKNNDALFGRYEGRGAGCYGSRGRGEYSSSWRSCDERECSKLIEDRTIVKSNNASQESEGGLFDWQSTQQDSARGFRSTKEGTFLIRVVFSRMQGRGWRLNPRITTLAWIHRNEGDNMGRQRRIYWRLWSSWWSLIIGDDNRANVVERKKRQEVSSQWGKKRRIWQQPDNFCL